MNKETIEQVAKSEDLQIKIVNEEGEDRLYVHDSDGHTVITSALDHLSESLREQGIETRYDIDEDGIEILIINS